MVLFESRNTMSRWDDHWTIETKIYFLCLLYVHTDALIHMHSITPTQVQNFPILMYSKRCTRKYIRTYVCMSKFNVKTNKYKVIKFNKHRNNIHGWVRQNLLTLQIYVLHCIFINFLFISICFYSRWDDSEEITTIN